MSRLNVVGEKKRDVPLWGWLKTNRSYTVWSALLIGLGMVVILGGVASLFPPIAILAGCVILLLTLVEPNPILIVFGLTLLLPLTGGLARGSVVPFLRAGQALVLLGFFFCMLAKPAPQGKFRFTAIDLAFILYLLGGIAFPLLSLFYRGEHLNLTRGTVDANSASPLQTLLGPVQYYLLYRVVVATVFTEKQIKKVLHIIFIASIIVSSIGILEGLHVGPVKSFLQAYYPISVDPLDYNNADLRIASTLQHYSGLGAYLTFTLIIILCCYIAQNRLKISPLFLAITTLLDSIALVLTGTFAAWTGLAVGMVIVCLVYRRFPKAVLIALVGVVLAALIFQSFLSSRLEFELGQGATQGILPESFAYRVMLWQNYAFPAIGQHLIFGSGPAPAVIAIGAVEESQYFHLLLEGGIVYLLSYLVLIGVVVTICWRKIATKEDDVGRSLAIATLAIVITMNVMNISGEYFTYTGGAQTSWIFMALVVVSSGEHFKKFERVEDENRLRKGAKA